ncbi:DUF397 domain-containing protein [Streptomyces soliscabiei]|uniref:DUF397 domain-containing protein n=1 Tax=Streptomyces soliscabiei TaxID=588897 RepID=UPI0029B1E57C|nr:DUF397 domain-containing protein [Streptomyces sp. NY05-11A]MDX2681271.1 DUF397 domain-containing protein [Streptomyces sp. NY05-11A]
MDHTLHWQKSSFSDGGEGNTCVELATTPTPAALHLRESDTPDAALSTTPTALAHLLAGIRAGLAPQRTTSKTFF